MEKSFAEESKRLIIAENGKLSVFAEGRK